MKIKNILNWVLATILICVSLVELSSCDKLFPVEEINPQDIDLADLEWDLDFPYEVYMSAGAAQELKDAYAGFIEAPVSALTDDTYMVILDHLSDLPEAQLVELYLNDVVIAVLHPVKAEFKALFEKYPKMGYFRDDDRIDGAKLVAVSSWNNGLYIIPDEAQFMENYSFETDHPTVPNPADAAAGYYDPDESPTYTCEEGLEYDLAYYFFGAFLEDLLAQQALYDAEEARTKADSDNTNASIKKIAGREHVYSEGVLSINEVYFRTSYRFNGKAPVTVSYDVYPIHVYEGENGAGDYYFMDMTANVANDKMFQGKNAFWTGGCPVYLRWCGAYAKTFKVSSTLVNNDNNEQVAGVSFPAEGFPFPETIIKTTNYSKTKSFNIGTGVSGNLGGKKGKGPKGGGSVSVNAGWSWSDTKSWSVKDVDVENRTANSSAAWALTFNELPYFQFSEDKGFNLGNSRAYRSSMQLHGSWVWYIPDMPDDTEAKPLRVKVEVEGNYGFMKFWGTKADLDTYSWTCSYTDYQMMPKMENAKAGNLILKNNTGKYISNIMIYNSKNQLLVPEENFQNSYPDGTSIKLGAYKCTEDIIVKFKMDGQTYVYNLNKYIKTVFKEDVTLYAAKDFKEDEK